MARRVALYTVPMTERLSLPERPPLRRVPQKWLKRWPALSVVLLLSPVTSRVAPATQMLTALFATPRRQVPCSRPSMSEATSLPPVARAYRFPLQRRAATFPDLHILVSSLTRRCRAVPTLILARLTNRPPLTPERKRRAPPRWTSLFTARRTPVSLATRRLASALLLTTSLTWPR